MASKRDMERMAKAIGRARKRGPASEELLTERIVDELAAEFAEAVPKLERGGHGGAERLETLVEVEMMT